MGRWQLCAMAACCACLIDLGCKAQPNVANAAEHARPHLAAFAQFDRWARRAGLSERATRDRDGLSEATFAPIRNDRAIAAAWVQLEGKRGFTLAFPANAAAPPPLTWVALRDPELGPLRVAAVEHCRDVLPHTTHALTGDHCVLISRSETDAAAIATTVTLAFEASVQ